jgi:hypothetical protein
MESDDKNEQPETETKIVHQQKRKTATKKTSTIESNHEENHQPMKKLKSEVLSHDENSNNADDIPTKKPIVRKKKVVAAVSHSDKNEETIKNDDQTKHEVSVLSKQVHDVEELSKTPISIDVVDTMDVIVHEKTTPTKKSLSIADILKSYQQDDDDDEEEHTDVKIIYNQVNVIEHNKKIFVFNDCDNTLKIPYKSVLIMAMTERDAKNILLNYVNDKIRPKKKLTQIDINTVPFIHDEKNTLCLD